MIPEEQKGPEMAAGRGLTGSETPLLNLGKKLKVPQDLMMEELSLCNNRGSLLFQKRQRRVQKFTFEYAARQQEVSEETESREGRWWELFRVSIETSVANGPEEQNYGSAMHNFAGSPGGSQWTAPVEPAHSPSALAPGYAEPLKDIPPEKFNHTAIPKGYHCPWQDSGGSRHFHSHLGSLTPHPANYRNFNKTPVPFGGPLGGDTVSRAGPPSILELTSGLELLRRRPSFNRIAQGWVRSLPESEEL
ncbi:myozenin-3 [Sorex araneus]|uniref:myozenin-3 n=1 Tax=Sorex araneus TaxID=42254 RepID=UPI002433BA60|nr:myozenin-3 [Sorex araneus]